MGQFCVKLWAKNIYEISRYLGDHLSGAGNWRSQEANGGPLPQASRAKPSFTGFPDSSQTYLLAFCNAVLSLTTDTSSTFLNYCYIWLFFAVKPNSVPSGFCVDSPVQNIFGLCFHFHPHWGMCKEEEGVERVSQGLFQCLAKTAAGFCLVSTRCVNQRLLGTKWKKSYQRIPYIFIVLRLCFLLLWLLHHHHRCCFRVCRAKI